MIETSGFFFHFVVSFSYLCLLSSQVLESTFMKKYLNFKNQHCLYMFVLLITVVSIGMID